MNPVLSWITRPAGLLLIALCSFATGAWPADGDPPESGSGAEPPPFKLSAGWYSFSGGTNALDINLRQSSTLGNLWFGYYESGTRDEHQWRTGWDHTFEIEQVRFQPSLQFASQGFAAYSVQVETGQTWFVGAGFGRTNLRPYWNLNFDPNDSYMLSAGKRSDSGESISLQLVHDNRQNPDQRHIHLLYRTPRPGGERFTFDLLYKSGTVDDALVRRWGASLAYDWPRLFVRLAYDPKVNFTPEDMWRVAVGTRF